MNKILRYSFVALLAMVFENAFADTEVTFTLNDPDAITALGIALPDPGKGTKVEELNKDGVKIVVTSGATESRIYQGSGNNQGKYDFRIYKNGGSLTFTAGSNAVKKIVFTGNNLGNLSGDGYSVSSDKMTGTWEGDNQSATLTATGTATIYTITVTFGASTDTRTTTAIEFSEGYETKVSSGLTGEVSLPTATVKAGENIVGEATWSLTIQRWSDTEDQPIIKNNKQVEIPNGTFGVVTLKAEYAGNETYKSSSKSYTLTVYRAETTIGLIYENIIKHMDRYDNGNATELSYWPVNLDEHGKVTIREEKVTYIDGRNVYITDGSQGMLLYFANNNEVTNLGLKVGSKIKLDESKIVEGQPVGLTNADGIYGTVKFYNGMPELALDNGGFGSNVKIADGDAPSPKEITIDKIQNLIGILATINGNAGKPTSDLQNNFSANVFINNYVTIKDAEYVGQGSSTSIHKFKIEEQEFTVSKYKASLSDALVNGAKYTLTGLGTLYKSNNKFSEGELDPQLKLTIDPVKTSEPTGINTIKTDADANAPVYNLAGQKVESSYKGLVIKNGKKVIQK